MPINSTTPNCPASPWQEAEKSNLAGSLLSTIRLTMFFALSTLTLTFATEATRYRLTNKSFISMLQIIQLAMVNTCAPMAIYSLYFIFLLKCTNKAEFNYAVKALPAWATIALIVCTDLYRYKIPIGIVAASLGTGIPLTICFHNHIKHQEDPQQHEATVSYMAL